MILIEQPPMLPWLGFCEALIGCSTVALYDTVQYTERGWQNRNRIKTADGLAWVTVPVTRRHGQLLRETRIADSFSTASVLKTLRLAYARTPYLEETLQVIVPPLSAGHRWLVDLNVDLVTQLSVALGARTTLRLTSEMSLAGTADKTERLVQICAHSGEQQLWAGSGTRQYLDTSVLARSGIAVIWNEFAARHPQYAQAWPRQDFQPGLSVVDAACAVGWAGLAVMLRAAFTAYRSTALPGEPR
ncbi:WbqC family protein [Streptomyces olivochromogenes]|uniref:WbqC family protein n=1 Tax=Streptomyces olivochromogenes TaxID=1963 RepID=UPI0036D9B295